MSTPTLDETTAAVHAILAAVDAGADHFSLLQIPVDADQVQIRDAYFRWARLVFPESARMTDDPELRRLATRAFQLISAANATLADPTRRRAYVESLARSLGTSRRTSSQYLVPVDVVGRARPSSTEHPMASYPASPHGRPSSTTHLVQPMHQPTPGAGTVPAGRSTAAPEALAWHAPTPSAQPLTVQDPGGAPTDATSAAAYVDAARIQLGRRDWAAAQETLQLALPVLTEPMAIAECKVMLGRAIYGNMANVETFRLEQSKRLWNEVAVRHANTPHHGQAAYHLAMWHKLHGEPHLVMHNLQICLDLLPEHTEANREKRLLSKKQFTMSDLANMEARVMQGPNRRVSSDSRPEIKTKPVKASWLAKLFGADDDKR